MSKSEKGETEEDNAKDGGRDKAVGWRITSITVKTRLKGRPQIMRPVTRSWIASGFISLLTVGASVLFMSIGRAASFGPFSGSILWECLWGLLLAVLCFAMLRCFLRRFSWRACLCVASVCLVLSLFLVETWFYLDERSFRNEVEAGVTHSRSRWAPFGSYGLICQDGSFYAHD